MNEIHAIIIDDEPNCVDNLTHYLQVNCPRITITGTGEQPECIERLLNTASVDLAFLDVHLFDRNIFDWMESHHCTIPVVFVTAYKEYALPAFRVSALDYLLKPLETSEVLRCYNKITAFFDGHTKTPAITKSNKITLRQGNNVYVVHLHDILLLKANGFYTDIHFEYSGTVKKITVSKPISLVYPEWNDPMLMRVHRSYAVNLKSVAAIKKTDSGLLLDTRCGVVPVPKKKCAEFLNRYNA